MVCGRPSSSKTKSSLPRLLMIFPCLSRTVAGTFTTFTVTLIVGEAVVGEPVDCESVDCESADGEPVDDCCGAGAGCWAFMKLPLTNRQSAAKRTVFPDIRFPSVRFY